MRASSVVVLFFIHVQIYLTIWPGIIRSTSVSTPSPTAAAPLPRMPRGWGCPRCHWSARAHLAALVPLLCAIWAWTGLLQQVLRTSSTRGAIGQHTSQNWHRFAKDYG